MGLSVVSRGSQFSNDLPIYGRITAASDLLFATRPGLRSFADLSGNSGDPELTGSAYLSDKGLVGSPGGFGDTAFKEPVTDDITVIVCARVFNLQHGAVNRAWLASSYRTSPISGIGFLITADPVPDQPNRLNTKIRAYLTATTSTGSTVSTSPTDLVVRSALIGTDTGYLYLALTIDSKTGTVRCRFLNADLVTERVYANDDITAVGRNAANGGNWALAGGRGGSAQTATTELQQLLIYGRLLTEGEIQRQYAGDKVWLEAARGIVL